MYISTTNVKTTVCKKFLRIYTRHFNIDNTKDIYFVSFQEIQKHLQQNRPTSLNSSHFDSDKNIPLSNDSGQTGKMSTISSHRDMEDSNLKNLNNISNFNNDSSNNKNDSNNNNYQHTNRKTIDYNNNTNSHTGEIDKVSQIELKAQSDDVIHDKNDWNTPTSSVSSLSSPTSWNVIFVTNSPPFDETTRRHRHKHRQQQQQQHQSVANADDNNYNNKHKYSSGSEVFDDHQHNKNVSIFPRNWLELVVI